MLNGTSALWELSTTLRTCGELCIFKTESVKKDIIIIVNIVELLVTVKSSIIEELINRLAHNVILC